jgi:predicted RNase H-like nuclease (RuvC/YqgF family)
MPMNQNVLATIIAAGGAIFVKIIEKWMEHNEEQKTENTYAEGERIRQELRVDVERLHDENEKLRNESDKWRAKYWRTQTQESGRIEDLKAEIERLCLIIDHLREGENEDNVQ